MREQVGTLKHYAIGFILCIVLTLASYFLVANQLLTGWNLIFIILGLGVIQMAVQLLVFMHMGRDPGDAPVKTHWNLIMFFFMAMVVVIIVFGSLWIMYTLNYREMPPMDMSQLKNLQNGGL